MLSFRKMAVRKAVQSGNISGVVKPGSRGAMIECSISILTKNEGRNIRACLEAVYSQQAVGPFEVVLVDSGSTDGTLEIAKRFPVRIEQISPEAFHYARTRNLAAGLGTGHILISLAGDAVPASNLWLHRMIANFADPGVGAVYGRQLPNAGAEVERHDTFEAVYGDKKIVKDPAHHNGMGYRFYHFSDVNSAIRRSVWETTPFPEELKTFEDLGIAKRILDGGWKIVYEPEAAVFHSHHYTTLQLFKRYFDIGYTLKRLQIWDVPGTRSSMLRGLLGLLRKQFARITDREARLRVPAALGHDFAKSAGLLLGLNQRFLPLALKRHLSAYRVFE
jgi:rhamnosyltransferase